MACEEQKNYGTRRNQVGSFHAIRFLSDLYYSTEAQKMKSVYLISIIENLTNLGKNPRKNFPYTHDLVSACGP